MLIDEFAGIPLGRRTHAVVGVSYQAYRGWVSAGSAKNLSGHELRLS
jgi:hypothetical protein